MTDITETLEARAVSYEQSGPSAHHTAALLREAKFEIERLRAIPVRAITGPVTMGQVRDVAEEIADCAVGERHNTEMYQRVTLEAVERIAALLSPQDGTGAGVAFDNIRRAVCLPACVNWNDARQGACDNCLIRANQVAAMINKPGSGEPTIGMEWQPIDTAPLDGSNILIYTRTHGQTEAHFAPGEWVNHHEGREYNGPVWVCGDDAWEIEVEDCGDEGMHHGEATHWKHLDAPPIVTSGQ